MAWQKDEYSDCHELLDAKGRLIATVDVTGNGWTVWDAAGQQRALCPSLEVAKQKAYELNE